jgi:hypothetical protein
MLHHSYSIIMLYDNQSTNGRHCMSAFYCSTVAQPTTHKHGGASNKHYLSQKIRAAYFLWTYFKLKMLNMYTFSYSFLSWLCASKWSAVHTYVLVIFGWVPLEGSGTARNGTLCMCGAASSHCNTSATAFHCDSTSPANEHIRQLHFS